MSLRKIIIAIVGKSGSGKTIISKQLSEKYGIPFVVSYTTRDIRDGEIDGIDHIFLPKDIDIPDKNDMLAYTYFGGNHYWALHEQLKDITSYVIDEKGLIELINDYNDVYDVIKVYVHRNDIDVDDERKNRDNDRLNIAESFYDIIIDNNGTYDELVNNKVEEIYKFIKDKKQWQ